MFSAIIYLIFTNTVTHLLVKVGKPQFLFFQIKKLSIIIETENMITTKNALYRLSLVRSFSL